MEALLKGRNLINLEDYDVREIDALVDEAMRLKEELAQTGRHERKPLADKHIILYFEKKSLRTRVSFEIGCRQLGGNPVFLPADNTHAGRG